MGSNAGVSPMVIPVPAKEDKLWIVSELQLKLYFAPKQLGVGIPGGCEAAVHAARRFMPKISKGIAMIKLDFSNAFNTVYRSKMLSTVARVIPEIYRFCHLAYGHSSVLKFETFSIISQRGAQQGDPIGPLLFCLSIQELLNSLSSPLVLGYLDDLTLGGPVSVLADDVELIKSEIQKLGLSLNVEKCEIITDEAMDTMPDQLNKFTIVSTSKACLLGAPLSTSDALATILQARISVLSTAMTRLQYLYRHDALTLLRNSVNHSCFLHTLRCAPCMDHPELERFDLRQRECLSKTLNIAFTDSQWLQASLPIKVGGLGIRRVTSLALPAFIASAASTADLQEAILANVDVSEDNQLVQAKEEWSLLTKISDPLIPMAEQSYILNNSIATQSSTSHQQITLKQSFWDKPLIRNDLASLFKHPDSLNSYHQARLKAVTQPNSGVWLVALPISSCGLRLDDEAIRIATGLRIGADICAPHQCQCGVTVTVEGAHGLSCRLSQGRSARHSALNDTIWRALGKAGFPSTKEPTGLCRSDGKRPDGVTLIPWSSGRCLAWDVTVVDTVAKSYVSNSAISAGSAAEEAAKRKDSKYETLSSTHHFAPVAFETFGPINDAGNELITSIGRAMTKVSGEKRETFFLRQRLSVIMQRFSAIAIRGTFEDITKNEGHDVFHVPVAVTSFPDSPKASHPEQLPIPFSQTSTDKVNSIDTTELADDLFADTSCQVQCSDRSRAHTSCDVEEDGQNHCLYHDVNPQTAELLLQDMHDLAPRLLPGSAQRLSRFRHPNDDRNPVLGATVQNFQSALVTRSLQLHELPHRQAHPCDRQDRPVRSGSQSFHFLPRLRSNSAISLTEIEGENAPHPELPAVHFDSLQDLSGDSRV